MDESSDKSMLNLILDTAQGLFIRFGYQGLSMRQIAEAVGVTKAALYYYFKDKEQLFLAVIQKYLEGIETQIDQITAEQVDARVRIRQFVKAVLNQGSEKRALIRLASQDIPGLSLPAQKEISESFRTYFFDKLQAMLKVGMQQGEIRKLDAGVATWALLGMLHPFLGPGQAGPNSDGDQQLEDLLWIYLHGISQPGHY